MIDIKPGIILLSNGFKATYYVVGFYDPIHMGAKDYDVKWSDLPAGDYVMLANEALIDTELYTDIFI